MYYRVAMSVRRMFEAYHDRLHQLGVDRHTHLETQDCTLFMKDFEDKIHHALQHSSGPIVTIVFPKGCGANVREFFDQQQIVNYVTLNEPVHTTNQVTFVFDGQIKRKTSVLLNSFK